MRQEDGAVPPLVLQASSDVPLYMQLFDELRDAIVSGRVAAGARLPSTRALAEEMSLSRTTTSKAYRQLLREGYVVAGVGSGTYVAGELPESTLAVPRPVAKPARRSLSRPGLSARGQALLRRQVGMLREPGAAPFRPGATALDAFPYETWRRVERSIRVPRGELGGADPRGHVRLRQAVARHLAATRGLLCEADDVVITSGTRETMSILGEILLDPGDSVLMEDPGYRWVTGALERVGARVVPVAVDDDGMRVPEGIEACPGARLAYVTPSNQFPMGVTLSTERRYRLLEWAGATGSWILEDDYDSEYRFHGPPLPPIRSLGGAEGCTIYLNTFRKILFPALSLGFVVLPRALMKPFRAVRAQRAGPPAVRPQLTLARFLEQGHMLRHIRSMRHTYELRSTALREALGEWLEAHVVAAQPLAGVHLVAWLRGRREDQVVSERAAARGIIAPPLSAFRRGEPGPGGLVLGFGGNPADELRAAVHELRNAFAR